MMASPMHIAQLSYLNTCGTPVNPNLDLMENVRGSYLVIGEFMSTNIAG